MAGHREARADALHFMCAVAILGCFMVKTAADRCRGRIGESRPGYLLFAGYNSGWQAATHAALTTVAGVDKARS
jgi:hypothetical protein